MKKKTFLSIATMLFVVFGLTFSASAVNTYKGPLKVVQADAVTLEDFETGAVEEFYLNLSVSYKVKDAAGKEKTEKFFIRYFPKRKAASFKSNKAYKQYTKKMCKTLKGRTVKIRQDDENIKSIEPGLNTGAIPLVKEIEEAGVKYHVVPWQRLKNVKAKIDIGKAKK